MFSSLPACLTALFDCGDAISQDRHALLAITVQVIRIPLEAIPEDSIDYAVMEKSDKVKVVPCDMGWPDLGSFDALYVEVKQPGR